MNEERAIWVLNREQLHLWDDLNTDIQRATNGYWSMAVEARIQRIIRIARLVGPTNSDAVMIPLLKWGVYKAILEKMDIPFEQPTDLDKYAVYWGEPRIYLAVAEINKMTIEDD